MSPLAEKELKRRWSFADKSDLVVGLVCSHLLIGACGYWLHEAQQRNHAEVLAALPKPTNAIPKADWAAFDCKELRAICWNRSKQRLSEYVH